MVVVVQKVDLDTCAAALLLGVGDGDLIRCRTDGATPEELADPNILCIEAGASGSVELRNFDHHSGRVTGCATRQALSTLGAVSSSLVRLTDYVEWLDTGGAPRGWRRGGQAFPYLSSVFSGMRLIVRDPVAQMHTGILLLRTVIAEEIDPFSTMPEREEWKAYVRARRDEDDALRRATDTALLFSANSGLRLGYVQTDAIGGLGLLYRLGADVGIACSPYFRLSSDLAAIRKYTIGSRHPQLSLRRLLETLLSYESDWGGPSHGTIIASPRRGSLLPSDTVRRAAIEML